MQNRMTLVTGSVIAVLVSLFTAATHAAPPTPAGDPARWDVYWQGLMQLREGQFKQAVASLNDAQRRAPADGRVLLGRGVAHTLLGQFKQARDDLSRARLPVKDREAQLWSYALDAMSGVTDPSRGIPIPQSLRKPGQPTHTFKGIPGHMIQGGKDYSTAYASTLYYGLAMPYRGEREAGRDTNSPAFTEAKRKVGRWFAHRALARPELTSRNFDYAKRMVSENKLRDARQMLDLALSVNPFDADMNTESGNLWMRIARPATARWDYTKALTINTRALGAYTGRSLAAASMGDTRRARSDLALVNKYSGKPNERLAKAIDQLFAKQEVRADPLQLLGELEKQAVAGAAIETLVPIAERLHRAHAPKRVRYAEQYQDKLRELDDAARADPKAIKPRIELALYLHDEASNRGGDVETRRGVAPFRWQHTSKMELGRALHYAEQAVAIDPEHTGALVAKAYVLDALGRTSEADRILKKVVNAAGKKNPAAVRLLAQYYKRQIGNLMARAFGLRMPTYSSSTHYERRYNGVWKITETTRHAPSSGDLSLAAALQRQAAELQKKAKATMEAAIKVSKGTHDGLLLEASYEDWFGSRNQALRLYDQAVKRYPNSIKAHDELIRYLRFLGQHDHALKQEAASWQLFETTAAPLLKLTWRNIKRDGWAALAPHLERARKLDPIDARATAYLAIAEREARNIPRAIGLLKVAAALERARLKIDDQGAGTSWPRDADDMANLMQIEQDLGLALRTTGKPDKGFKHTVAAGDLALRYPHDGVAALMWGAMRPDPKAPELPIPKPVNGATLASRAHLAAGKALQAKGRNDEAQKYFRAAAANTKPATSLIPNIGDGKGDNNFGGLATGASATALIELAKVDIANKQYKAAFKKLQNATQAGPTREERRQINEMITKQVIPHLNRAIENERSSSNPQAAQLIAQAKREMQQGQNQAALKTLNLAIQRNPTPAQRREINQLIIQAARAGNR